MSLLDKRKGSNLTDQEKIEMKAVEQSLAQAKAAMPDAIVEAHKHSAHNLNEIGKSKTCGCFYCLQIFPSVEIVEWIDDDKTALCPECDIDAVIGDAAGYELNPEFLRTMYKYWFS